MTDLAVVSEKKTAYEIAGYRFEAKLGRDLDYFPAGETILINLTVTGAGTTEIRYAKMPDVVQIRQGSTERISLMANVEVTGRVDALVRWQDNNYRWIQLAISDEERKTLLTAKLLPNTLSTELKKS